MSTINRTGVQAAAQFAPPPPPPPPKPEPKPLPEIEASAQAAPTDLLSGISERLGFDAGSIAKAKFNSIIDQGQNIVALPIVTPQFLSDAAAGLIDAAKKFDPSSLGSPLTVEPSKVAEGLQKLGDYAAKGGEVVYNKLRERVGDALEPLRVTDVNTMQDGDVIKVSSKGSASVEVGAAYESGMEIKRTKDAETGKPVYTVSLEATPELTGTAGIVGGSIAPGAKIEYKFDSPEEVEKFSNIAGRMAQCKLDAKGANLTPEESKFMNDHISSVEAKLNVGGQGDASVQLGHLKVGVTPGVKATQSVKIEYKDGKPVSLVRTTELAGSSVGKAGLNLINSKSDGKGLEEGGVRGGAVEGKGTITVETKIPLDSADAKDIARLIADPAGATMIDKAETTIKVVSDLDAGAMGTAAEMEISDLSADEATQILEKTMQGKPQEAFDGSSVKVKVKHAVYEDRGFNINVGIKLGGVGVEYESKAERRHETHVRQNEFTVGTAAK